MGDLLTYSTTRRKIASFVSEHMHHFGRVNMNGMINDLRKIKAMVEDNYTTASYMTYDIGYHGWSGDAAQNMYDIEKAITDRMLEIYAICMMGLGEQP